MTDTISAADAPTSRIDSFADGATTSIADADTPIDGDRPLEWAPIDPAPKKRRLGLWLGLGAGAVALGAAAASLVLIAPGTSVAGVNVGFMTPGAAAEALSGHLATTEVTLTGAGGDQVVTGADLGAALDAKVLAEAAFADRPMWNVTMWMGETIPADITLDRAAAERTLRAAVPDSFVDPVDASVVFDPEADRYVTTAAAPGTGIDVDALTVAFVDAVADGSRSLEFSGDATEALPLVADDEAKETAGELNEMLAGFGFYVGEERTVPVEPAVAADWIQVTPDDEGSLQISADSTSIQTAVNDLAGQINREPVDAKLVVNGSGKTLRTLTEGVTGRELGDVSTTASDFASQIADGDGAFQLPVEEVEFATTSLERLIEVDLSSQMLYMKENGKVVDKWSVSTGKFGTDTDTGRYTVGWKTTSQNMGRKDLTVRPHYYQPNVKWVMYFNGDQALHGVYWHSNWGTRMSHGCVGMREWQAQKLYEWTPQGVEVWVHN